MRSASKTKKSGTCINKRLFVKEISFKGSPEDAHARLSAGEKRSALLESARVSDRLGRWSIAAADPVDRFEYKGSGNPFPALAKKLERWKVESDLRVPFAGGAVGYLTYECAGFLEPKRPVAYKSAGFPQVDFLFFDKAIVFDHALGKKYLVYCGNGNSEKVFERMQKKLKRISKSKKNKERKEEIETSLPRAQFVERVCRIKEHIAAGDIFQANLAQLISFRAPKNWQAVYSRLKRLNPSPFFGILNTGDAQILSGSPERLLRLEGSRLDTRPIAGTRPRGRTAAENRGLTRELLLSPKERAEHVMLVDLERNDLGRVCEPGSVRVDEFMAREEYSHVQHIVSNVEGRLRGGLSGLDALEAFFPGGTITGAPKVRSMEIIRAMEPAPRGPYTGSLGYLSFSGAMDFNILIRSLFIRGGRATLGAGAGIVADSDPQKEYDETLHKASAVLRAACGEAQAGRWLRRA